MASKPQPIRHGTLHAYKARGCRCHLCRRANADSCRDYLRRKGVVPAGQPCAVGGRRFTSQAEAAHVLGVSTSAITYHLDRHGNLDRIGMPPGGKAPLRCKAVRIGEREWESQAALERYLGVKPGRVYDWLHRNQMDRLIAALMRADAAAASRVAAQ